MCQSQDAHGPKGENYGGDLPVWETGRWPPGIGQISPMPIPCVKADVILALSHFP